MVGIAEVISVVSAGGLVCFSQLHPASPCVMSKTKERLNAKGSPELSQGENFRGMHLIRNQLEDTLKKRGLERIIIAAGNPFDPNFHEAVGEAESDQPEGTVAEEIGRGYTVNGRVVRPARVKIAKAK